MKIVIFIALISLYSVSATFMESKVNINQNNLKPMTILTNKFIFFFPKRKMFLIKNP